MALQVTNEDCIHTINGGVSMSEYGCGRVHINDSMCMQVVGTSTTGHQF